MSSSQTEPRRSQRPKKAAQPVTTATPVTGKRKRKQADAESDNDGSDLTDIDQVDGDVSEDDNDDEAAEADVDEYEGTREKSATSKKGKVTANKSKNKTVNTKAKTRNPKNTKTLGTGRSRKTKQVNGASFQPDQLEKEARINADNPLFNAIVNPAAALQGTVEDFLESLNQSPEAAQAELINLILRSCGCNDTVNSDEVVDYDGVVDALDNFTEGLKKDESPTYPLTSKLPMFKKFRLHLSEFISRLILASADLGSLYQTDIMETLRYWVVAMSSSQIRSFRHTATVVALELQSSLCDVARKVEKEVETVGRQREGEKKRRAAKGTTNNDKSAGIRDKELDKKMKEVNSRKSKLAELIKDLDDGVFIHRYRDLDPIIRAECVTSLGIFFKKHPSHFLSGTYLRYVGWVLSDSATTVRIAAVKSLQIVYALSTGDGEHHLNALNHFTERFKPRLLEMAESDTDIGVRVGVLAVLGEIDKAGLLDDEDRDKLCNLVFSEEPKVRKAVAKFVDVVWQEWIEEHIAELEAEKGKGASKNKRKTELDRARIGYKGLAALFVKWGSTLDELLGDDEDEINDDRHDETEDSQDMNRKKSRQLVTLAASAGMKSGGEGRIALAVEALWDEIDTVSDWEGILDTLLLDHTASGEEVSRSKRAKINGRKRAEGESEEVDLVQVDDAWRLEEVEETALLQILVASLRKAKKDVAVKKGEEDATLNDITRALIKGLPRLFIKYQTDKNRIADVLVLPTLMNLDLYLEMRMLTNYAALWDDVTRQLLNHSSLNIIALACNALIYFMNTTSLSNTNSTKILEFEDQLSKSLRDAVEGHEEIEMAEFNGDDVLKLTSLCMRLRILSSMRDMTTWTDEDEGGMQSSVWHIMEALAERGRFGYREEEEMVGQALDFLTLHVMWKSKHLAGLSSSEDYRYQDVFLSQRESLINKLTNYTVGTESNSAERVRRSAFKNLLDLHVLFSSLDDHTNSMALTMDDEVQYRCAGYIQAEIERFAETISTDNDVDEESEAESENENENENDHPTRKRRRKSNKEKTEDNSTSSSQLTETYIFVGVVSTFIRALKTGTIHIRHGATVLGHFGRLGSTFDQCSKYIVEILRDEGLSNDQADILVEVVTQSLQEGGALVIEGAVKEDNAYQLAKTLSSSFVLRGTHLAVIRKLDAEHIVQIQLNLLSWLGKRLASLHKSGAERSFGRALSLFRAFIPLLSTLQSQDALKIKAHLDQTLAQEKVQVSPTAKIWEPHKAYEKRLTSLITKGKGGSKKSKGKSKDIEQTEDEEESEVEKLVEGDLELDRHDNPEHSAEETDEPRTPIPKPRPRPRATYATKDRSPQKHGPEADPSPSQPTINGLATPLNSRKRLREETEEQDTVSDTAIHSEMEPEPEPEGDVHIRRKRIRH